MAVVHGFKRFCNVKFNRATHAATTHDTFRWRVNRIFAKVVKAGVVGIVVVAGQVAGNFMPGGTMSDENVAIGFFTIVVTTGGRDILLSMTFFD